MRSYPVELASQSANESMDRPIQSGLELTLAGTGPTDIDNKARTWSEKAHAGRLCGIVCGWTSERELASKATAASTSRMSNKQRSRR